VGVPTGGSAGQVLAKIDGTNYNTEWVSGGGGDFLPLAGGSMDADATIALEDTVVGTVSEVGGYGFAVSSASAPGKVSNVLFDRILVKDETFQTTILPAGIEFADATFQTTAALPFDGGAITGPITMAGATIDSEISSDFFGIELSADHSQFAELDYNSLTVANGAGSVVVNPTGITFPNASVQSVAFPGFAGYALESWVADGFYPLTGNPSSFLTDAPSDGSQYARQDGAWSIVSGGGGDFLPLAGGTMTGNITFDGTSGQYIGKGTFDTSRGGNFGLSLVCSIGYEFNWQAGWLTTTEQNSTTPRPLYLDSLAGTTLRSWDSATSTGVEVAHTGINVTNSSAYYVNVAPDLVKVFEATNELGVSIAHDSIAIQHIDTPDQTAYFTNEYIGFEDMSGTPHSSWIEHDVITVQDATDTTQMRSTGLTLSAGGSITFGDATTQNTAAYVVGSGDLDMMGNNITNANFSSAAGQVSAQNITMSLGGVLTFGDNTVQSTAYTGGGGGVPEAPVDGYVYGRVNAMWYRIPGVSPFSQIATNVTSVASWTVSGADIFLSPSGVVSTNNAAGVSAFNLNGGSTSSTVFDFSSMTSLSGNIYLVSQSATATPVFASNSGLSFLYYSACQFSSLPSTIGSFPNLTTLNVTSCPNITDVSSAPSTVTTMSITASPVTSLPSFANVNVLTLAGVAITSGPSIDYNTSISQFYCGSNASMTTAPSLNGCTSLGTVSIYDNPLMATAPSFTGCSGLGALNVYGNDLMPYPPGISGCSSLGNIQCYNNPLMTSFGSLSGLTSLSYVDLHNCAITDCDSIGYACASNASNYGIFYGYLNVSGGTNQTFDSTSLPSWIGDLQSMSWTVVYNSY
jgi:hypothetical protein